MRLVLPLLALLATAASAQTLGRAPAAGPSVSLDALLAVGDDQSVFLTDDQGRSLGNVRVRVTAAVLAVSARMPVGRTWTAVAEVPLAYVSYDDREIQERLDDGVARLASGAALGNPYLGAEARPRPDLVVGAGVRLPLARYEDPDPSNEGSTDGFVGGLTADAERVEAYLPNVAALRVAAEYQPRLSPALGLRLHLAPTVFLGVRDDDRRDLGLGYGLLADLGSGPLAARVGVTGRRFLRGDEGFGFFDTTLAAALSASLEVGGVRPGVVARVPLTGDVFGADAVVGLSLDVPVR